MKGQIERVKKIVTEPEVRTICRVCGGTVVNGKCISSAPHV